MWLGQSVSSVDWFISGLVDAGGDELIHRLRGHRVPERHVLAIRQPDGSVTRWHREEFEVSDDDMHLLTVYFPADASSHAPRPLVTDG